MKTLLSLLFCTAVLAQPHPGYWQQHADYTMDVNIDVKTFRYSGTQELVYTNKSPDTLRRVFYHLYFNAFQPNSEMDVRSRTIVDPDVRVGARIEKLTADEIGFLQVVALNQDGAPLSFQQEETILADSYTHLTLPTIYSE